MNDGERPGAKEEQPHFTPGVLETAELSVHFGSRSALERVSFRFGPREIVSVLGPNGAGKSTLLKCLAGMIPPTHGAVRFNGQPMSQPSSEVVYVPQRSGASWLFPVNVLDVVLMGYRHQTRWLPFGQSAKARAMKALEQVGMAAHARVQIGQLSGGQQQRVFLARALVQRGAMYLLDEPFAGVDIPTQELLVRLFERLRAAGRTIIYATHDLDQAAISSDRVVLINHRLVASGAPGRVLTEANIRETFGGRVFVVPGTAPSEVQQQ